VLTHPRWATGAGELFANQARGPHGVGPITTSNALTFPTTFASQVTGCDLTQFVPNPERYRPCGPTQFALSARPPRP